MMGHTTKSQNSISEELKINSEKLEDKIKSIERMINTIQSNYKFDITEEELIEGAYRGLCEKLDNHSNYLPPRDYENYLSSASGTFCGIGISLGITNEQTTIISSIEGTPAQKAGLKNGDLIKFIDGVDISKYNIQNAVNLLRGEKGTKVNLGIIRGNNLKMQFFEIVRDSVKLNSVTYRIKENIGYIKIDIFDDNSYFYVKKALDKSIIKNVEGFIIDLRNNPGGIITEVIKVADFFVPKDTPIVHIESKGGGKETIISQNERIDKPLVVLVNSGSASASEIFAGAVQDTKTATIIGTTTYGKGTIQSTFPTANGGCIILTTAEYLTPNERRINGIGITPDIVINDLEDDTGKDIQLNKAIEVINTPVD